jgi:membrane associated rhomboid family serine protease
MGTQQSRSRGWTIGTGDADAVLTGARRAFFVMAGILVLLWIIQIANWADGSRLVQEYGIRPRSVTSLPDIVTAPFLHFSWSHIEGNSGPLFIFGFLAAYRGVARFFGVTAVVVLASGLAAWLTEPANTIGAGASGVVFGYFGYIMVRGLFDRHALDIAVGAVMALCFAYQFAVLLPHRGIGWQAHIGGLIGGLACGWLFRERRPKGARRAAPAAGTAVHTAPAKPGKQVAIDPANPRAELYKELDDLGL